MAQQSISSKFLVYAENPPKLDKKLLPNRGVLDRGECQLSSAFYEIKNIAPT